MPTVEVKIWLAIKSRIDTLLPTYKKAWPAETFAAPSSAGSLQPYLRTGSVSVEPVPVYIKTGTPHLRTGSVTITLVHPIIPNATVSFYSQIAGKIAEHFHDGVEMRYNGVCVKVPSQPHVMPGYEDNGYWNSPVLIRWRTYA